MIAEIEGFLKKVIGLDGASIGSATIARSVRRRMEECGLSDEGSYFSLLGTSDLELQALIDEVTVPETWFFRDIEPFRLLAEYALLEWLPSAPGEVFRVLSVPCSSGEEPYSIAMVLMDVGLKADQFHIDAVDISARIIARAKRGIYGRNSFRGDEGDALSRHFIKVENASSSAPAITLSSIHTEVAAAGGWERPASLQSYEINQEIRQTVNFKHGNLLDKDFLGGAGMYDAIFCRNLLIYFDRPTQSRALEKIHKLLVDKGILFLGHAEAGCVDNALFSPIRRAGAFSYKKNVHDQANNRELRPYDLAYVSKKYQNDIKAPSRKRRSPRISANADTKGRDTKLAKEIADDTLLDKAKQLADQGKLAEAAEICERYLEIKADSAAVYYLLGVVREAAGDSVLAVELFNKALYLDPRHYQALVHLAAHAERQGDVVAAATYLARARRVAGEAPYEGT